MIVANLFGSERNVLAGLRRCATIAVAAKSVFYKLGSHRDNVADVEQRMIQPKAERMCVIAGVIGPRLASYTLARKHANYIGCFVLAASTAQCQRTRGELIFAARLSNEAAPNRLQLSRARLQVAIMCTQPCDRSMIAAGRRLVNLRANVVNLGHYSPNRAR